MAEFPAMPLWTDAYLADTGHLNNCEHGLYLKLLILLWRSPGRRIPNDDVWLERRFPGDLPDLRKLISEFCQCDRKWVTQSRLSREFQYVAEQSEKQREKAKSRWEKAKALCHGTATPGNATPGNAPTPTPTPTPTKKERKISKYGKIESIPLPTDWKPSTDHYAYGKKKGKSVDDIDDMAIGMRSWAEANGKTKENWHSMFMGWIKNEGNKPNGNGNGQGRPRPLQDDRLSLTRAADRLIEANERGEFKINPRPSLFPTESQDHLLMLPKGRSPKP